MHLLLIHQNFPGQFRDLGPAWLAAGHRLTSISNAAPPVDRTGWDGLQHLRYTWPEGHEPSANDRGQAVAELCRELQSHGLVPDIVLAHSGWGEALKSGQDLERHTSGGVTGTLGLSRGPGLRF